MACSRSMKFERTISAQRTRHKADEALDIENPYAVWVNKNKGWNMYQGT